ncbi:MAG: molybdenum cofactor guanylyltransferase [Actinomycetota bacterium]|nr:molybdenum cofactor guanylyltransferase [Actinomycetota bacterium]
MMSAGGRGGRRPDRPDFSAAVLAGGKGRRLGTDKTYIHIGGKPVLESISENLLTIFPSVLLVVKSRNFPYVDPGPGVSVVSDVIPGKGPLGGIYTALEYSTAPYVFVMACDMPYPSLDLIEGMLDEVKGREAVVPRRGDYIEPLFAVYARSTREKIRPRLEEDRLKIQDFIDELDVRYLDEDEIATCDPCFRSFFNINTPEDLRRAPHV